MGTSRVVSARLVAAIPPLKLISTATKLYLGVAGCCCLKTSAQWDLPSEQEQ
jgi:hypothetical protein